MAIEKLIDHTGSQAPLEALYMDLHFPEPPPDRPYIYNNMVSTVDGKILIAPPGSTAKGVGGPTDQLLMRRLQGGADGAIIGAGTLRPGNVIYDPKLWRAVITRSGELPLNNRFFTDAPEKAIVFAPRNLPEAARERLGNELNLRLVGEDTVDVAAAVRILREEFGIKRLLLEGGASVNFDFYEAGLIDELFLSFSPKIKGGEHIPTIVTGAGLPGREYVELQVLSLYHDGDEFYFRYKVGPRKAG